MYFSAATFKRLKGEYLVGVVRFTRHRIVKVGPEVATTSMHLRLCYQRALFLHLRTMGILFGKERPRAVFYTTA
jgi:hypothetical protein